MTEFASLYDLSFRIFNQMIIITQRLEVLTSLRNDKFPIDSQIWYYLHDRVYGLRVQ